MTDSNTEHDALSLSDRRFLWHPFTQMREWSREDPVIIEKGKGIYLWDTKGNRYFDGYSSLWVNLHGHCREEIDRAVVDQLSRIAHSTFLGLSNVPAIRLAERLIRIAPAGLTRVFYSDNGSTAVEVGLKMAYQYWQHRGGKYRNKTKFVALANAYHGDTVGTMSVGGIPLFQDRFRPLYYPTFKVDSPNCYRCPLSLTYPDCRIACADSVESTLARHHSEIAALILEPGLQAAGGMVVHPRGYLERIRELATRYDILLILDEVATGFGRTGRMFACSHEKVSPDILAVAKGLTGGYLPLAATLTTEAVYEAFLGHYDEFKTFFHGHSYTGNPLACAAAIASLDLFEQENILDQLQPKIALMQELLYPFREHPSVGDVRQAGWIGIIELVREKKGKIPYPLSEKKGIAVCREAGRRGLLIRPLGNVIAVVPPLCTSSAELRAMLEILMKSVEAAVPL